MFFLANLIKKVFVAFRDEFFYVLKDERGIAPLIGAALISTAGGLAGGLMGGGAAKEAAQWKTKMSKQAYDEMLKRAQATQTAGESALTSLTSQPLAELGTMRQDILNQTNDVLNAGSRSLQANLAQAGLRGGQAGTQLARGVGSMTTQANQDLNKMIYDEATQRKLQQMAYEAAKAQTGTQANLQQF